MKYETVIHRKRMTKYLLRLRGGRGGDCDRQERAADDELNEDE